MPAAKRRAPFRRTRRVKRRTGVTKRVARPLRSLSNSMVSLKRVFLVDTWAPNTTSVTGFWRQLKIQFSQIPQYTEMTAMFGQYRINAIRYSLVPCFTGFDGSQDLQTSPAISSQTNLFICHDKYTTLTPSGTYGASTLNAFMEQGKIQIVRNPNALVKVYVNKPTIYYWDTHQGNAPNLKVATWQRTDNNNINVDHYGPNVFVNSHDATLSSAQVWQIYATVYLQLKNQK